MDIEWYIPDSLDRWDAKHIKAFFLDPIGEFDCGKPFLIFFGIPPRIIELADDIGKNLPSKFRSRVALYTNIRMKCELDIVEMTSCVPINVVPKSYFYTGEDFTIENFKEWFRNVVNGGHIFK